MDQNFLNNKIDFNYEDLADEKYQGRICTRSGKHPYNVALVASMIAEQGEIQLGDIG